MHFCEAKYFIQRKFLGLLPPTIIFSVWCFFFVLIVRSFVILAVVSVQIYQLC